MLSNLEKFRRTLPYASEIYGVYQPLIGWKSRLINKRLALDPSQLPKFPREVDVPIQYPQDVGVDEVEELLQALAERDLFAPDPSRLKWDFPQNLDSLILRMLQEEMSASFVEHDQHDEAFWLSFFEYKFDPGNIQGLYQQALDYASEYTRMTIIGQINNLAKTPMKDYLDRLAITFSIRQDYKTYLEYVVNREIYVARYLVELSRRDLKALAELLLKSVKRSNLEEDLQRLDPRNLMPRSVGDAVFSPIGIINLFRHYFFEFDTFLGQPVEHIWLSPGSTIELVETSSRKTRIERATEQFLETISRSERNLTEEDEISQAIKAEYQKDVKLGSSLSAGVNILVFNIQASGKLDINETTRFAREENHKQTRQQSSKLSSEIRQNYKSTFKLVSEVTDTHSKRYVIENKSPDKLINYELRRKMRQVGVQVQDAGTQLCWQVYVDDPGQDLGLAELVHLASKADLSQYPTLSTITSPEPMTDLVNIDLVVPNENDRSNLNGEIASGVLGYVAGGATGAVAAVAVHEIYEDLFGGGDEGPSGVYQVHTVNKIMQQYKYALPDGYQLAPTTDQIEDPSIGFLKNGGDIPIHWPRRNGIGLQYRARIMNRTEGLIVLEVDLGEVTSGEIIEFQAKVTIMPTQAHLAVITEKNKAIAEQNKQNEVERDRLIKQEFVNSVKERIDFASRIATRKTEDLREEERTIIYRKLIASLMRDAWNMKSDKSSRHLAHLRSELIKSIFDVDKMLYFVAPEWWQPRLRGSEQDVGALKPESPLGKINYASQLALGRYNRFAQRVTLQKQKKGGLGTLADEDSVSWGGAGREDNYLITESSEPAKLGSSLGWLLQLDGDNLRNAFLNAPWVKAVMPIRLGREKEALQWLMESQVEGTEGLDALYADGEGETIRDAILDLADEVMAKHNAAGLVIKEKLPVDEGDNAKEVYYLAPEYVFEKGFDPLEGGFKAEPDKRFEIIDQWVEILPTDQIVAVEVEYDPKTGKQL